MKKEPARTVGNLSLAQLRALEAVVRTGSFTEAAKELGVSQPSISNHIQGLESRFKTKLLVKSGYSVSATPALAALLPRIRALLALAGDLETELSHHRALAAGELRIGYSTYQLAIPIISSFMANHPTIAIEARALASQDIVDLIETGSLDIGFITGREIPAGLKGELILKTRVVLAVPPEHPLTKQENASWKDVAELPLLQREGSSGTRRLFEAAATLAGIRPMTALALGSWGSIATLVRSGSGIGVALEAEISERDGCVGVPIEDANLDANHFAVWQKDMDKVAAIEAFRDGLPTS
ncbi:LysR family transcriptional regulator [Stappia sp. BW2]|uniref:LysR family transcriptional regulator n=1 Tax=Stappia sp. BW2 TaxID=2592622 RepID=UPI0011DE66E2|nr:LysR substrate-binding domain-containing protein [Stappia sp. BW2]TYC65391.1 LysR family transcriptional regulator [Stappia sp. BW2]